MALVHFCFHLQSSSFSLIGIGSSSLHSSTIFRSSHRRYFGATSDLQFYLKKRLWHRCFSVNFAEFLRTPFLQKSSGGCFWKSSIATSHLVITNWIRSCISLRKKCPHSEFFWSVFSRIRNEYGEIGSLTTFLKHVIYTVKKMVH